MARYAINYTGLRQKPTYDSLLGEIANQPVIRFPDRRATQLRNSPYLTQLDGVNQAAIAEQQARTRNEELKRQSLQELPKDKSELNQMRQLKPWLKELVRELKQRHKS